MRKPGSSRCTDGCEGEGLVRVDGWREGGRRQDADAGRTQQSGAGSSGGGEKHRDSTRVGVCLCDMSEALGGRYGTPATSHSRYNPFKPNLSF